MRITCCETRILEHREKGRVRVKTKLIMRRAQGNRGLYCSREPARSASPVGQVSFWGWLVRLPTNRARLNPHEKAAEEDKRSKMYICR